jgi:hypothetical protein
MEALMRFLCRLVLLPFALALVLFGCSKSNAPPPVPTDVTLNVPGMH